MTVAKKVFIYRIDRDDHVVYVGDNWQAFADENGATAACSPILFWVDLYGTSFQMLKQNTSIKYWLKGCESVDHLFGCRFGVIRPACVGLWKSKSTP